jgi:hypothetical protein
MYEAWLPLDIAPSCGTNDPDIFGQANMVANIMIFLLIALSAVILWSVSRRRKWTTAARFYELTAILYLLHAGCIGMVAWCSWQGILSHVVGFFPVYYGIIVIWMTALLYGAVVNARGLQVLASVYIGTMALSWMAFYLALMGGRGEELAWMKDIRTKIWNIYDAFKEFPLNYPSDTAKIIIGVIVLVTVMVLLLRGMALPQRKTVPEPTVYRTMCREVFGWLGLCELLKAAAVWSVHMYQRMTVICDPYGTEDTRLEWNSGLQVRMVCFAVLIVGLLLLEGRRKRRHPGADTEAYRIATTMAATGLVVSCMACTEFDILRLLIRCSGLWTTAVLMYWISTYDRAYWLKICALGMLIAAVPVLMSLFDGWLRLQIYGGSVAYGESRWNGLYVGLITVENFLPLSGIGFSLWHFRRQKTE